MADNSLLNQNLLSLRTRHPDLAQHLSHTQPCENLSVMKSRKGPPIPVLKRAGRVFPMHSRIDPVAEGRRIAQGAPEGYLVAFGLGAAYHLNPLVDSDTLTGLLIVESSDAIVRGLMEFIDLRNLFSDSRVILLVNPSPELLVKTVLNRYLPVLYGNLGSITLRSRWDANPEWFSPRARAMQGLPEALGKDYTVQTRFGRRWFVHTLANLERSERVGAVIPPSQRILITAAGPSLEDQLPKLRKMQADGATLLATDTALPMLASSGIIPDIVLSIDCQAISYHHFLRGLPQKTALILDLASPPVLTRMTDNILFIASGHPFSLYLNRFYRPFPILDLSGGHVTYAAVSLARATGAQQVYLFGADFSYPSGQPYAKNTYLYPYFQSKSTRLNGSENSFYSFIWKSRPRRERKPDGWLWRTSSMDHYRESLEQAVSMMECDCHPIAGRGIPIRFADKASAHSENEHKEVLTMLSTGAISKKWPDFLEDYQLRISQLPPLNGPPQDYLEYLDTENRQAWATLLPTAATFRNESPNGPAAVEKSRRWTLARIQTLLKRYHGDSQIIDP